MATSGKPKPQQQSGADQNHVCLILLQKQVQCLQGYLGYLAWCSEIRGGRCLLEVSGSGTKGNWKTCAQMTNLNIQNAKLQKISAEPNRKKNLANQPRPWSSGTKGPSNWGISSLSHQGAQALSGLRVPVPNSGFRNSLCSRPRRWRSRVQTRRSKPTVPCQTQASP